MPAIYRWRMRSRIYRWYKELREVDPDAEGEGEFSTTEERLAELNRIEDEVARVIFGIRSRRTNVKLVAVIIISLVRVGVGVGVRL